MFGKLSLWAANTYHGPSVPKLDIQRAEQHSMPATYAMHSDELFDNQTARHVDTPAACEFDPQGFNPISFNHWSINEKVEFLYEHKNTRSFVLLSSRYEDYGFKHYKKFVALLHKSRSGEFIEFLNNEQPHLSAAILQSYITNIWVEMLATRYMHENEGRAQANLISWITYITHGQWSEADQIDVQRITRIQTALTSGDIPYVILHNTPPKLNFPIENYSQFIAAIKTMHADPALMEFMQIITLDFGTMAMCKIDCTEEQYEKLPQATRATLRGYMKQLNFGIAFGKFKERYGGGIPPELHAKWSQYGALSPHNIQSTLDALLKPWHHTRIAIIRALYMTPMLDEIYHMFPLQGIPAIRES